MRNVQIIGVEHVYDKVKGKWLSRRRMYFFIGVNRSSCGISIAVKLWDGLLSSIVQLQYMACIMTTSVSGLNRKCCIQTSFIQTNLRKLLKSSIYFICRASHTYSIIYTARAESTVSSSVRPSVGVERTTCSRRRARMKSQKDLIIKNQPATIKR